jgi:hypothetical protein
LLDVVVFYGLGLLADAVVSTGVGAAVVVVAAVGLGVNVGVGFSVDVGFCVVVAVADVSAGVVCVTDSLTVAWLGLPVSVKAAVDVEFSDDVSSDMVVDFGVTRGSPVALA